MKEGVEIATAPLDYWCDVTPVKP